MNKQQEPRLRFKGFTGAWEEKYLGKLAEQVKSYPLSRNVETSEKTGFKYIHYGDIHRGIADIIDSDENLPNIQAGNFELLKSGDLVVADVSEDYEGVGAACVIDGALKNKVVSGLHTIAIRPNQTISLFLYYLLKTQAFKQYGRLIGTGTKVVGITASKFLNFQTNIPTLPEQTHLGNFFRRLDSQIAESRAVLEKSRQLKKAMLAKMFPANGEKIPKIRFKGFEGEWECRKLGEVVEIVGGYAFKSVEFGSGNMAIIRISNILPNGSIGGDFVYFGEDENLEKFKANKNDYLIAMSGATTGKIGQVRHEAYINQRVGLFRQNENSNNDFIGSLLQKEEFLTYLMENWGAGAQPNISIKQMENYNTYFPNLKEQTAIGNFFRQLDETIALQSAEVEKLNQLKKGLLAAMLV